MRSRTRQIIAITLLATALCADRALAAAPAVNHQIANVACRVVSRFASHLRRTVPAFRSVETRHDGPSLAAPALPAPTPAPDAGPFAFSPFQFRLPPPTA